MIKKIILSILCITSFLCAEDYPINQHDVILKLKLLDLLDGKAIGIGAIHIHAQLIIRTQILHMLHGVAKGDQREGIYTFNNKKYTVSQLSDLEHTNSLPDKNCLKKVKTEFTNQIRPFLDLAKGFKPQMVIFINESLRLRHRDQKKSILLKWAELDGNDDMSAFNQYVQSFHDLSAFLYELLDFLDDMISSCPKAKQLYLNGLKTEREKKMYAQRFAQLLEKQKSTQIKQ